MSMSINQKKKQKHEPIITYKSAMSRTVRIEGPLTASLCAIHDMVLFYSYLYNTVFPTPQNRGPQLRPPQVLSGIASRLVLNILELEQIPRSQSASGRNREAAGRNSPPTCIYYIAELPFNFEMQISVYCVVTQLALVKISRCRNCNYSTVPQGQL